MEQLYKNIQRFYSDGERVGICYRSWGKLLSCLIIVFCFFLQSCNWFFHPEETHISTLESYCDYENALNGIYGILEKKMSNKSFFFPSVMGDDIYEVSANYSLITGGSILSNAVYDNSSWADLYKVITSANNFLIQYYVEPEKKLNFLAGEAHVIRAYCYFRLTKIYGRIPLINNIEVSYVSQLPSFQEVYKFIETDINKAISLLPGNKALSRISGVTPHRGTAKALLAELYLYWGGCPVNDESKYQLAASIAEEVIDSAVYFGFELEDDFANLWEQSGLYSTESVFSVYITSDLFFASKTESKRFYENEWRWYPGQYYYNSLSYWATETAFYNNYPKDYRRDITFINAIDYYFQDTTQYGYEKQHIYIDSIEGETSQLKLGFRKFFYDMTESSDTSGSPTMLHISTYFKGISKIYLYRYAHTLLTYAEAAARSNNLNEKAYKCLNLIRRRANNLDLHSSSKYDIQYGLSAKQFADSVVQERAWELAGEPEGRWFDQIRTGQAGEDCFFAIPDEDVFLNPNLGEE